MPLNDDDARAVDWIMSQQPTAESGSFVASSTGDPVFVQRAGQVRNLMALLDLLPAEQPPADLVRRTLERIHGRSLPEAAAESTADRPQA